MYTTSLPSLHENFSSIYFRRLRINPNAEWFRNACICPSLGILIHVQLQAQWFREIASLGTTLFGVKGIGGELTPSFVDIDGDHDLCIFMGEENGFTQFFENIGSPLEPNYNNSIDHSFGITDVQDFSAPTFVDIDADGDYDCFIGVASGIVIYFENVGIKYNPVFQFWIK